MVMKEGRRKKASVVAKLMRIPAAGAQIDLKDRRKAPWKAPPLWMP
jgi:hypothetical protein